MRSLWQSFAGWGVNVAVALTALRTNLMRSILTTLGVMIGVFSVILAVAIGGGRAGFGDGSDRGAWLQHGDHHTAAG